MECVMTKKMKVKFTEDQDHNLFKALKAANPSLKGFKINKAISIYAATGTFPEWLNVPSNIQTVLNVTNAQTKSADLLTTKTGTTPVMDFNIGVIDGYANVANLCKNGWDTTILQKTRQGLTAFFKGTNTPMKNVMALIPTTTAGNVDKATKTNVTADLKVQDLAITNPEKLVKTLVGIYLNTTNGKAVQNVPGATIIVAQMAINALNGNKVGNIKDALSALAKVTKYFNEYPVIAAAFNANSVLPEVTIQGNFKFPVVMKTPTQVAVSH